MTTCLLKAKEDRRIGDRPFWLLSRRSANHSNPTLPLFSPPCSSGQKAAVWLPISPPSLLPPKNRVGFGGQANISLARETREGVRPLLFSLPPRWTFDQCQVNHLLLLALLLIRRGKVVGEEVREDTHTKILPPPAAEKYREVSNELTISQKKEGFLAVAALMKGGREGRRIAN